MSKMGALLQELNGTNAEPKEQPSSGAMGRILQELPAQEDPVQIGPGSSPSSPIQDSPVGFGDRFAMSFGNAKGNLNYLKKQYEDVKYDKDHGLVVKKDNQWRTVDPKALGEGDAWTKTKELAKDLVDLSDVGVNVGATAGAIALAPATGGATLVAAAGAGGLASGGIKTILGRAMGTYEATAGETMKDITLEGLLNLGGQYFGAAIKPTVGKIATGIKNFAADSAPAVRNMMAGVLAKTAKLMPENAERVFNRAPQVMGALDKSGGDEVVLKTGAIEHVKALFTGAGRALGKTFEAAEEKVMAAVPKGFRAAPGDVAREGFDGLAQAGVLVPKAFDSSGKVVAYKIGDMAQIKEFLKHPEAGGNLPMEAIQRLNDYVKLGNSMLNVGEKQGAEAASQLIAMRRAFDKFYFKAVKANPDLASSLAPISSKVRSTVVAKIGSISPEVAELYGKMNADYVEKLPFVAAAERMSGKWNVKAPETFVNQISQESTEHLTNRQILSTVAGLKGKEGQALKDMLEDKIAARDFVSRFPQIFNMKHATGGALIGAAATHMGAGPLALGLAAPLVVASSPRVVGRLAQGAGKVLDPLEKAQKAALPYAHKFGDFIKGLTPEQAKALIAHPQSFETLVRTTLTAAQEERQMTEQMLKEAGVK